MADSRPCCHRGRDRGQGVRITDYAETIDVEYRTDEWYAARREGVSASEIAAVVGLSPWTSRFDLWWLKRDGTNSQAENNYMRRGRRYEALVLEDFAEEHPEYYVAPSATCRNLERPWQVSTPDGLAYEFADEMLSVRPLIPAAITEGHEPIAVIEAKTGQRNEWGEPGTDDIPVQYRCQVLWQMDTLGLSVAYLPVLFGDQYAEYVVEYDETDVRILREAAEQFLADVRSGSAPPVDGTVATARRLKKLHPSIVEGTVEVRPAVIAQYQAAKRLRDAAEARMRLAENRVRAALGDHNIACVDGQKVASRSVYDVKPRVQEVKGYTVNRLNFNKPKRSRGTIK